MSGGNSDHTAPESLVRGPSLLLEQSFKFSAGLRSFVGCLRGRGSLPQLEIVAKIPAIFYRDLFSLGLFALVGGSLTVL